jgi:tripartite-type tricarboxylate transporter receptor subunit TctC
MIANLGYDPLRDFAPITMAVVFANVLVVQPSLPVQSLADFVKLAQDKPGSVTFGSSGIGGAGHLAGELLKERANIDMIHVPYKGGGPAMQGMLGGQVMSIFATPVSAGGQIKAGKVRAIATTGPTRAALLPEVPTVAESGYPGYEAMNWYAYVAPAKTPKEIVERLNRELVKALNNADVAALLHQQGLEPSPGSPAELARYIEREYQTWGRVVKRAGIKSQ